MTTELEIRTVGELVAERPSRARVFENFGIDYCCGGKRSLMDACRERGLPVAELTAAIRLCDEVSTAPNVDWTKATLSSLIDHIVGEHHGYLRKELPRLDALNAKVCRAHGANDERLGLCHAVFREFCIDLFSHMMKEEQILFPAIKRLEAAQFGDDFSDALTGPISVMEDEHESAGNALRQMSRLTNGFTPPPDACNSYRAWLSGLADLEQDMHAHVHKENSILFPRALALALAASRAA